MSKAKKDRTLITTPLKDVGIFKPRRSPRDLSKSLYSENNKPNTNKPKTLSGDLFLTKSERTASIKDKRKHIAKIRKTIETLAVDNMNTEDYVPSSLDQIDMVSVKPVNLLNNSGGRGLFASEDIPAGTCIGIYTGVIYSNITQFKRYLQLNPDADNSYAMTVAGRIVDAATKGNFTRYINFSDSQDNAAFEEGILDRRKVVKVVATKDIKAGQQFLINYNTYEEQASKVYFFLNPNDGALSAREVCELNQDCYELQSMSFDAPVFNLSVNQPVLFTQAAVAVFGNTLLSSVNNLPLKSIDLPILTLNIDQAICDFAVADVFTPLMAASYFGQVQNVLWLIEHGANIDQQQNQSGNCPLFLALEGYSVTDQDKTHYFELLNLLIDKGVSLAVHDRADRTFLHKAITILSDQHFSAIINKLNQQNSLKFKELFTFIEENNLDIVTYCLKHESFSKLHQLLVIYPEFFNDNYEGSNQQQNLLNKNAFKLAIQDYDANQLVLLKQFFEENNINISSELLVELGLGTAPDATMGFDF
jgi:ankyrin repeat protein